MRYDQRMEWTEKMIKEALRPASHVDVPCGRIVEPDDQRMEEEPGPLERALTTNEIGWVAAGELRILDCNSGLVCCWDLSEPVSSAE